MDYIAHYMADKKETKMSVMEYASMIGLTRQGVLWRIWKGLSLPGVSRIEKVGRMYVLIMD